VQRFPLGWQPLEQFVQELDGPHRVSLVRLAVERCQQLLAGSDHSYAPSTTSREQLGHCLITIRLGSGERERPLSHDISSRHDASLDRTRKELRDLRAA
jgi:hypothetical protein